MHHPRRRHLALPVRPTGPPHRQVPSGRDRFGHRRDPLHLGRHPPGRTDDDRHRHHAHLGPRRLPAPRPVRHERKPLSDAEVDSRFFAIVSDLVGTPTELVDETGTIAWRTRATVWGTRATVWGTTAVNPDATAHTPLRHPGQYADPETGLHYNYFRHYDPETVRYVSPDRVGLAPCRKDHYEWTQGSNGRGGSIRYKPLDHHGRPTGVSASIRPEMLDSGTEAGKSKPPAGAATGPRSTRPGVICSPTVSAARV
ncbi:RHS repeat-associated core domain-containing protein [Streptomyces sp. NPDC085866]|uniref:RHS repeat-associated core domain-containing protein n=1 Tax=Streptomyces sp. NPDC085866 TaxID=3365736 RepID=UPI0037D979C8